jgi:UDP-glucose 4-epimerase
VVNVAVTGATGNVGTAVVTALRRSQDVERVVAVARRLPEADDQPDVTWVSADIARDDLTRLLAGADVLVHLAWRFQPTRNPRDTWRSNVVGSTRTFEAARDAGVTAIVHASSVGAYSPFDPADPDRCVGEDWPTDAIPTAAYGTQKSYLERTLDAFELAHPDIRVVRIRSAFVFQRAAAPEQRRIFAGPLLPGRLLRLLPFAPVPTGLRFQTVHAEDLAAVYTAAVLMPVSGAFNVAADPVVRASELAQVLRTRAVALPAAVIRAGLATAFRTRLTPAEPGLLDLFLSLPLLDTARARSVLSWEPQHSSTDALTAFIEGLRRPIGGFTPPLDAHAGGRARLGELATGVGQRE